MKLRLVAVTVILISVACLAQQPANPNQQLAHDVLKQIVEINSASDVIGTEQVAKALQQRLIDAGYPAADVQTMGPDPKHTNLLARLRGRSSAKAILMIAHMDVVPARREDWSMDPFTFNEKDGYYYGRGVSDDKQGDANIVSNLIRWKKEGLTPQHDIIAVLTCDEESSGQNGIAWMLAHNPELKSADLTLNADGGGGDLINGKRTVFYVQASEKVYADFEFTVRDRGGHSSRPRNADNPIYRLAAALEKLSAYQFPVNLNEVTRMYFDRDAALRSGQVAADMKALAENKATPEAMARLSTDTQLNALMRTTCVATMVEGGHATNALPQMAKVNVNCRMLPNDDFAKIQAKLIEIFTPSKAEFRVASAPKPSPASPLRPELMKTIDDLVAKHFPGALVLPEMSTGATDGLFVRNAGVPVYGVEAEFDDPNDSRAHGRDERLPIQSFFDAVDFWHDLVPRLANAK